MVRLARPQQHRAHASLYDDSDDDGGSDSENVDVEATPKPSRPNKGATAKTKGKKRVSDAYQPANGEAGGSSPMRVPLGMVNINDDEAEKRKRRKSAKVVQPLMTVDEAEAEAGPSQPQGADGEEGTPRAAKQQRQRQQLMSVAETPVINVPLDVMSSNFEEWMKMATDNKINATNSWSFALIDYFHDMSLLRNNQDNSINFQKASCTLDGCVKIWTSRVDSVSTETGKLMSNIASGGKEEDEDEDGAEGDPADPSQRQKRATKSRGQSKQLASNPEQLRSKKLDLEFSVDPLFKKTCADFDEGGAQGLLMNHLSLGVGSDGSMRVIFDASDSMGKGKDEDEAPEEVEPRDGLDLSYLRTEFLPDISILDDKAIAHSLDEFSFAKDAFQLDASHSMAPIYGDDDDDDFGGGGFDAGADDGMPMDVDAGTKGEDAPPDDFFSGEQAVNDDYGDYDMGGDGDGDGAGEASGSHQQSRTVGFEPFDPRRAPNERDLLLSMTEPGANGSSLDYFDQTFVKNWAGPEHWKLRKVVRRPDTTSDSIQKSRREKKEPFKIDFLTPSTKSQKEVAKEIFAPVTRGGSITLPHFSKSGKKGKKGKEKEKRAEQTLPDDMHFSSRQLVTLFLKPKFALKMRGQRARLNDGEVDENFWAQAAADQAAGRRNDDGDEMAADGAIPFNTQFFHDDDDDDMGGGFDDVFDADGTPDGDAIPMNDSGERDLLSETQGLSRRVRPETVNYARRAKRVDVRKLKENIWKGLDIIVPASQGTQEEADGDVSMASSNDLPATDPAEAREFTQVISDLRTTYPKDKMDEISTSFCFICLLHLANEKGLSVEVGDDEEMPSSMIDSSGEAGKEDSKVGNIWGLKVRRDPNAIPSA